MVANQAHLWHSVCGGIVLEETTSKEGLVRQTLKKAFEVLAIAALALAGPIAIAAIYLVPKLLAPEQTP
jgi:hypothetical protein